MLRRKLSGPTHTIKPLETKAILDTGRTVVHTHRQAKWGAMRHGSRDCRQKNVFFFFIRYRIERMVLYIVNEYLIRRLVSRFDR